MCVSIKNLLVLLNQGNVFRAQLDELSSIFSLLDIVSDIYVASENIFADVSKIKNIINQVKGFLREHSFYRINIHPLHPFSPNLPLKEIYTELFELTQPFIQEGYLHQSVSRLLILPIIKIRKKDMGESISSFLSFLRERNLIPSLYLTEGSPSSFLKLLKTERERIYLELGEGSNQDKVIQTLWSHLVFDDLLMWVNKPVKTDLPVCRSVVFSEKEGKFFTFSDGVSSRKYLIPISSQLLTSEFDDIIFNIQNDRLPYYIETLPKLKETLKINNRGREEANIFFHLGLEWVKREEYAKALEQFNQALTFPDCVDDKSALFLSKALCHLRLHDIKAAQAALNEAEKQNPSSAMVYYYRGHCEFQLKDYIEAIEMFQKSLKMGPEQLPIGDVYFYMGLSHINIMEYNEALEVLRKAEKFYPKDQLSPVIYYMGVCYFGKNDIDTAYKFFQKALGANPKKEDLSSIYLYLGLCHKEKGKYQEAIEELEKARAAEEDRLEVHNLMGFCYYKLKEYDKAIECFLKAVEINPHSAIDWANLGVNVRAKGENEKAIILFKKALSLDPTIGFARKHLRELLEKKRE